MSFIPTYAQASDAVNTATDTPVHKFIRKWTPAVQTKSDMYYEWRKELSDALMYIEWQGAQQQAAKHGTRSISFMYMLAAFGLGYVLGMVIPYIATL